jgi:uncharacterized membrane protein YkvA (DUF1232 family)
VLRASAVEILLTATDLEEALEGSATGKAEVTRVTLSEGVITAALKVSGDKLPMAVPVELRLSVRAVRGTEVELGVAWSNMPLLPNFLKELALQRAFEALPGQYRGGVFVVDVTDVLDQVPVHFRIGGLAIGPDGVRVSLNDVMAFPLDSMALVVEPGSSLVPVPSQAEAHLPEHQDFYQKLREKVRRFTTEKAPRWAQPLVPWVLAVPDFFVLMVRLTKDPRVPAMVKVITGVVIAYFISPIDLIPDPIPLIGEIDDVAVALFALEQIRHRVPAEVVEELWPGEGQVLDLVKEGVQLFSRVLPGKMIEAIRKLINRN